VSDHTKMADSQPEAAQLGPGFTNLDRTNTADLENQRHRAVKHIH